MKSILLVLALFSANASFGSELICKGTNKKDITIVVDLLNTSATGTGKFLFGQSEQKISNEGTFRRTNAVNEGERRQKLEFSFTNDKTLPFAKPNSKFLFQLIQYVAPSVMSDFYLHEYYEANLYVLQNHNYEVISPMTCAVSN